MKAKIIQTGDCIFGLMTTWAKKILDFNSSLRMDDESLPDGIRAMNPFQGDHSENITRITTEFYNKYYGDEKKRHFLVGINPGRLGAGLTGIPFTDTKRLKSECEIEPGPIRSHEPSSVFVYHVINAYGGPAKFYSDFYINSVCPLGFVKEKKDGKEINFNYYDRKDLEKAVTPYIVKTLREQIDFGLETDTVFCMGTGKNYKYLKSLNREEHLFGRIVPLEHPRYVVQYKNKFMQEYVEKYLRNLSTVR